MRQDEIIEMARRVAGMITIHANGEATYSFYENQLRAFAKLVAEKQQRTWVGLMDKEIEEFMDNYDVASPDYAKVIEAKLKEKNT